jgi:hypothetical protein
MKQKFLAYIFLLVTCAACDTGPDKNDGKDSLTQNIDTANTNQDIQYKNDTLKQTTNNTLQKTDTLLTVDLDADNKGSISGYLGGMGKHVTIIVPVKKGDSLTAELVAENAANIRFNQVYIPVGKTGKYDGPFSRQISYPITAKGEYKLIIGENLMAEDDWSGSFTCNVAIK